MRRASSAAYRNTCLELSDFAQSKSVCLDVPVAHTNESKKLDTDRNTHGTKCDHTSAHSTHACHHMQPHATKIQQTASPYNGRSDRIVSIDALSLPPHQVSAVAGFSLRALTWHPECHSEFTRHRCQNHLLPAGAAAMPSSVRPAARLSAFSSAASIFSVHMTGGSSGLTLECPATPGLVPRSWSMMGSTPR